MKKTGKSVLCVFLSLLLVALSLCVPVFAEGDDGSWVPIPTSPAGLSDGDVYIDFTNFLTAQMQGSNLTGQQLLDMIAVYNGGTWLFDYDAAQLKGSMVVPASMSDDGTEQTVTFTAQQGTAYLPYILYEVGATWYPVAKQTLGLDNGDYYIDWASLNQAQVDFLEDVEIYYNPGSRYMELMFTPDRLQFVYYPLNDDSIGFLVRDLQILQYDDGYTWTLLPKSTEGLSDGDYYVDVAGYVDILVDENGNPIDEAAKQEQLSFWGMADYYLDADAMVMKITVYIPWPNENNEIEYVTQYISVENAADYLPLLLRQVTPCAHAHTTASPASEATADAHGYTAGVYCEDCGTWISGHEVIHNTLGERTYLDEYTEDGEQMVIIKCSVCGEEGLYAMEPVPAEEDNSAQTWIRKAIRSFVDFILRLLKWFSAARK